MAVPKLRFKDSEGREFPEWEEKKLGDFTERIKRKAPENSIAPVMMIAAESGFIYQKDRYSRENAGKSLTNYTLLKKEEFSYNHGYSKLRNYGSVFILKEPEARVPFVYHSFKLLSGVGGFWGYYLNSGLLDRTLKKTISSTARMDGLLNIGYEAYMDINVRVPALPEQEKIADFLSTYDHMIDIQSQRVEAMRTRKKGLLQKIFSQEIRFKDAKGREFPEWEKKKLEEVLDYMNYGMNAAAKPYDGKNKYLRITDIDENNNKYKENSFVSPNGMLQEQYELHEGDICFARTGASVGKTYLYDSADGKVYFAGFLIRGHVNKNYIAYFIFVQTLSEKYNRWVKVMSARTGQPGINMEEYKTFTIHVPVIEEQQKIADFLTAVDKQIEVEEKRLETMKIIKKGLLQQMFI